jgi:hypothetical protein
LSWSHPGQVPDRVLRLSEEDDGTTRLTLGTGREAAVDARRYFHHDLPGSVSSVGAPLCTPDLTPFGLQLDVAAGSPDNGMGIRLAAVLDDLTQVGLGHLVRTALA